jgi:hypothetical protein
VVVLAGGMEGYLCSAWLAGMCELEGPGAGVDCWEVGGGDPTESEAPKPKESRGRLAIITMAQEEKRRSLHKPQMK